MKSDPEMNELVEATVVGLERLRAVVGSLDANALAGALGNGWTVSAILAHLAFWDHWVEARWNHFSRAGSFHDLPDDITDLVNEASMAEWHALLPDAAARLCLDAAMRVTRRIERLSVGDIGAAIETERRAMVDRTLHWYPHADEIHRAVMERR